MDFAESICHDLELIRRNGPLVHNITNYVVMNSTANALLAIGASPVMAHAVEEVEEMVGIAGALVINIGTLSPHWIEAMFKAARAAKTGGKPIILDPVGAGATRLRTDTVVNLIQEVPPTIIRGNASEILALQIAESKTKGVDASHAAEAALESARALSNQFDCAVSISGETDLIVKDNKVLKVLNGHPLMPKVTGLGCTATALTGAFATVNRSALEAAANAMAVMGMAGEMAAEKASGPGSLQMFFLDALHQLNEEEIKKRLKMEQQT